MRNINTLLSACLLLAGTAPNAAAHDQVGSTDFDLLVPDFALNGAVTFVTLVGPAAGETVLHTTWNLTFTSPPGGTPASNVELELTLQLESGFEHWLITGADLGWPAATGTYSATLGSDQLNGVLSPGIFGFNTPELVMDSTTGGLTGKFTASTIELELAPEACQTDLGFGGPGAVSLEVCGDVLETGGMAELAVEGAPAFAPLFLVAGLNFGPVPFKGGTLVPVPVLAVVPLAADAGGSLSLEVPGGGGPATLFLQAAVKDAAQASGWALSNAVSLNLLP